MEIKRIDKKEVPFDLLYLADEDESQIGKYIDSALFLGALENGAVVGMIGLNPVDGRVIEIVCIAVYEEFQNRKIGSALMESGISLCRERDYREILIKTGNCALKQLYLYQACGFRFDSVNRDYFPKYYKNPIYENGIKCVDQIVLKYRIYSPDEIEKAVKEYWNRFVSRNEGYRKRDYEVWNFCYGEILPNKLIGLVKEGKKRGTSSAVELYEEGEKLPEAGDLSIITYGNGLPGCIIETQEIRIARFRDINDTEAALEGEGDLSLRYWREVHEEFFSMEYRESGRSFSHEIPVIFERFAVIYDEDSR